MNQSRGTPSNFTCTLTSTAPKERFWQFWTDVSGWPRWDTPLREAGLEGEMRPGATGYLLTTAGQRSWFRITECQPLTGYAYATALPGATLTVRRFFGRELETGGFEFTHHVSFAGPLGWLFAALLGRGFMAQLPEVMARLRDLAESGGTLEQ